MTTRYLVVCRDYTSEHATEDAALRQLEAMQLDPDCPHSHYVTSYDDGLGRVTSHSTTTDDPRNTCDHGWLESQRCPECDPLVDSGGYLRCGCHGSQRDHTCQNDETFTANHRDNDGYVS